MKKLVIFLFCIALLTGCNKYNNESNDKNKYEGIKYNLDEVYDLIKLNKFSNVNMYDLDYDKLNETQIIVGQQSFGTRDMLTNQEGKSTQRFLKYSMDDGTELTVIIGELSTDIINKDILTYYTDDLVKLDSNNNDYPTHLDSTVYSINNIIINIVSFNFEQTLDMPSVIKFKEEFVNVISPFIGNR